MRKYISVGDNRLINLDSVVLVDCGSGCIYMDGKYVTVCLADAMLVKRAVLARAEIAEKREEFRTELLASLGGSFKRFLDSTVVEGVGSGVMNGIGEVLGDLQGGLNKVKGFGDS